MAEYQAQRCPCGHPSCKNWIISRVADVQGVSFTQVQAEIVARVLSGTAIVVLCEDQAEARQLRENIEHCTPFMPEMVILAEEDE